MSSTYTKATINCNTNTVEHIPMTAEEIEEYERVIAEYALLETNKTEAENAKNALKASAQAKLIAGEPLTEEEAKIITN